MKNIDEVSSEIIGGAIAIHRATGPGLFESAYQRMLRHELLKRGLKVDCEVPVPLVYAGETFDLSYRADMVVEDRIVIEIKAVDQLKEIHHQQILTYVRLLNLPLGLLINFNVVRVVDGLKRVVNDPKYMHVTR